MSKYSDEFKLKVIKYCIEEFHGYGNTAKYFNIPSSETVRRWCKHYEAHGIEGISKYKNNKYDGKFKQKVVEYMHENHLSASETSIYFNLPQEVAVLKWERIYYEEGPQGLYVDQRGRNKNMSSNLNIGTVLNDSKTKATYTVTTAGAAVAYKAPANKKVKKVTIPSSVNINGITYKVTSIAPNAFKKCKKLKKVTIGIGVTEIGKNAFAGCKNLKNVIVKSKSLKKVGKNAFKGINKAAKIKVPKKQLKKYQKLFKKGKSSEKCEDYEVATAQ